MNGCMFPIDPWCTQEKVLGDDTQAPDCCVFIVLVSKSSQENWCMRVRFECETCAELSCNSLTCAAHRHKAQAPGAPLSPFDDNICTHVAQHVHRQSYSARGDSKVISCAVLVSNVRCPANTGICHASWQRASSSLSSAQVTRLFSINSSFYLTDLVFTPEDGARVVVGAAVHDEITYNIVVGPFSGRMWPNGVLRFKVVVQESFPMLHPSLLGTPSSVQDLSFVTPQPVPRQPSSISGDSSTLASNRLSMLSQGSRQSCCAVEEGKQEVKSIVDNFLRDFNGIMSSTFGDVPAVPPRSISPETVTAEPTSNVDDTNDVTIPGAFYRPTYIVPKEDAPMHRGITCDFCGQRNIRGVRHHCLHCPDFDLVCGL